MNLLYNLPGIREYEGSRKKDGEAEAGVKKSRGRKGLCAGAYYGQLPKGDKTEVVMCS